MKKLVIPLVTIIMAVMIGLSSACDGRTNEPNGDDNDRRQGNFASALEAFNYGKKYFEETATNYESTYFGSAKPQGMGSIAGEQEVYTHRYLSQNGDFFYDSANYSGGSIDVSMSFVAAKKNKESNIHYKKFDGKDYLKKVDGVLRSNYNGLNLDSLDSVSESIFQSTCGFNPRVFLNYKITEETISYVEYFNSGDEAGEFAYTFKFVLRSDAHENYKNQVKYFSGHKYGSFSALSISFCMDDKGRIVQVTTTEEYSVKISIISQKMKVEGTQYINYDKNPSINFEGFSIS